MATATEVTTHRESFRPQLLTENSFKIRFFTPYDLDADPCSTKTSLYNGASSALHSISDNTSICQTAMDDKNSWTEGIQQVPTFQESLKYNVEDDKLYSLESNGQNSHQQHTATCTRNVITTKKRKKCLSFDETVVVVPIPMRNEYSNVVKARLWSNASEIQENAARNSLEFAHEGWNWRNVFEEETMYVCVATGELVHPSHYHFFQNHGFR